MAQVVVQRTARHSGLHAAVHVFLVRGQNHVHQREVEAHTALHGLHVALQRRATAIRDQGHAVLCAQLDHLGNLRRGAREGYEVGRHARVVALVIAVLVAGGGVRRDGSSGESVVASAKD